MRIGTTDRDEWKDAYRRPSLPGKGSTMRKREMTEPNPGDKRYIRRDEQGQFTDEQADVGRSLAADNNQAAKTTVPKGHGDRGDRRRSSQQQSK
jgi:hypothetical protein